ncbi:MAG: NAD(P)/FAD-dependent oxidoreductase [Micrococcales bacterium]|nr:NAD(P)/FAD-dependent oxidoreductase [Micrococcales bacterium]
MEHDVVVVGAGVAGENAADRAGRTGLSVALVESEMLGGECSYWACMPSKALLRPGAALADTHDVPGLGGATLDPAAVFAYRDQVTHHWRDESQVSWARGAGLTVLRGIARLTGERTLSLTTATGVEELTARCAVILATGSQAAVPDLPGLLDAGFWTSHDATSTHSVPARLAVLGGGAVGLEAAQTFASLGSQVTLLVRGTRLMERAEPFAGAMVADALAEAGVQVRLGVRAERVWRDATGVHVGLDRAGVAEKVDADQLLVATGRRPATADLGLETLGLTPGAPLEVDEAGQVLGVVGDWLYAVGDVTGRTSTTHQGKYDARVTGDVVAARFGADLDVRVAETDAPPWSRYRASADAAVVPQVVFTRPEVASVGTTLAQAREEGRAVQVVDVDLADLAGATVRSREYRGRARFVVDPGRRVLVGATFVGPGVADMLHAATIAVVGQVPLDRLWHAVPSYPTLSEVWLRFLEGYGL